MFRLPILTLVFISALGCADPAPVIDVTNHVKSTASCASAAMVLTAFAHGMGAAATVDWYSKGGFAPQSYYVALVSGFLEGWPELMGYLLGASEVPTPLRIIGLPGFVEGCSTMFGNVVRSFSQLGSTLRRASEQRASMARQCPRAGARGLDAVTQCLRGCGVTGSSDTRPLLLSAHLGFVPESPLLQELAMNEVHSAVYNFCYQQICGTPSGGRASDPRGSNRALCAQQLRREWASVAGRRTMPAVTYDIWQNQWELRAEALQGR